MANKLKELIRDSVIEDGKLALVNLKDSIMNYSDENSDSDNTESSDCGKPGKGSSGAAEHRKRRSEFNGPGQKPPVPGFKHHRGKGGPERRRREQEM